MTLLEAVVALMVLGLSAVGFLDVFRAGSTTAARAATTAQVVAEARSAMEAASLGDVVQAQVVLPTDTAIGRRIDARPWQPLPALTEVVVTITPRDGAPFEVRRLVRTPAARVLQP